MHKISFEEVKVALLPDNTPAHPSAEQLTTSVIQPKDLGVISAVKRRYTKALS